MNLGNIKLAVQRQFGDESGAQITQSDITRWAHDAQVDIVRKTEVLQVHSETDVIKDDGSYDIPTDFIRIRRVTYNDKKLERIELEEVDALDKSRDKASSSTPLYYYMWGRQLWLYPKPSSAGQSNLDIYYLKMPTELVADQDVPEIPVHMHEDIVRYCLARAKELNEDDAKAQEVMMDYENRLTLSNDEANNPENDSYPAIRDIEGGYVSEYGGYW
jgi:hypothetical protein